MFYFYFIIMSVLKRTDHFNGLVVRVPGHRYRGPGSNPGATRFSEKGPLSLLNRIEEVLGRRSSVFSLET
jgi:hypothetical protein